jgi:hypothetical protein
MHGDDNIKKTVQLDGGKFLCIRLAHGRCATPKFRSALQHEVYEVD